MDTGQKTESIAHLVEQGVASKPKQSAAEPISVHFPFQVILYYCSSDPARAKTCASTPANAARQQEGKSNSLSCTCHIELRYSKNRTD